MSRPMFARVRSWPKITAIVVAGYGLGIMCSAWQMTWDLRATWMTCDWSAIVASAVLFIMSYLLGTGRDWARRLLLVGVILYGLFLLIIHGGSAFGPISISDISPAQADIARPRARLRELSSLFFDLSPFVFAVMFLCHSDVVASFRARTRASDGSNRATMETGYDRCQ